LKWRPTAVWYFSSGGDTAPQYQTTVVARGDVVQVVTANGTLKSPGLLKKHYAPKAKLRVLSWTSEADLRAQIGAGAAVAGGVQIVAHTNIPAGFGAANVSVIPHDAAAYARALYAELHRCDAAGAGLIVVEAPPDTPEWAGIADRLRRAAACSYQRFWSDRNTPKFMLSSGKLVSGKFLGSCLKASARKAKLLHESALLARHFEKNSLSSVLSVKYRPLTGLT